MKVDFIQTMDFTFENVEVIGLSDKNDINNAIENGKVIEIINEGQTEFINSQYIMFWG